MTHGLVVGKFYPPHAGHHHLIDTAARACERVTVVVAPSSAESIPLEVRLDWLREVHAASPHVRFAGVYCDLPIDYDDPDIWQAHYEVFRGAVGPATVDVVFSSEAYGDELARRFDARHVAVDPPRAGVPVSGTAIRADPVANWAFLAPPVRAWLARRVVVVGAESTGTTTLARALAAQLRLRGGAFAGTRWVPEYGRTLTELKMAGGVKVEDLVWDRDDFLTVVREQNAAEDAAARAGGPLLICDTDAFATAIWEERYLGSASPRVRAAAREPALYLLTADDGVPFEDDGMRDGEHLRGWMTGRFRAELAAGRVPWLELTGTYRNRLRTALAACDELLARGWSFAAPQLPRRPPDRAPGIVGGSC
ncbi:AAA family ATPase [Dactylosporangium siamense]|uniref:Transcriptional regulator NadR n=1 Tax=Dactylosporangium siamense TaxID=685454 RepID=A0A919UDQ6_9ACTN|nr:AAA family ATPase [Dactylosporangium siamense]GIG48176.1 transcriptional regulator NadR [Dactylosporangium siamense]